MQKCRGKRGESTRTFEWQSFRDYWHVGWNVPGDLLSRRQRRKRAKELTHRCLLVVVLAGHELHPSGLQLHLLLDCRDWKQRERFS